jgi:thiol-disulfide isomerase/thioredoxin
MTRGAESGFANMLRGIDVFQPVPRDLSNVGGADWRGRIVIMALGYAFMAILSVTEIITFSTVTWTTDTFVSGHMDEELAAEFSVTLPNLPCKYVRMGSRDAFGLSGAFGMRDTVSLYPLDPAGNRRQTAGEDRRHTLHSGEDIAWWAADLFKVGEQRGNLSSTDEFSTSDIFVRSNFTEALSFHDFTMVFFFANWCPHCQHLHPTWNQLVDSEGEVRQLHIQESGRSAKLALAKIDCANASFKDTCRDLKVTSFPTLRLYRPDSSFVSFIALPGGRTVDAINHFLDKHVQNNHFIPEVPPHGGCQIQGHLNVPRVEGNFYFTVGYSQESSPNLDLADLSHVVDHLSFGDADAKFYTHSRVGKLKAEGVPESVTDHMLPLDGKEFISTRPQDVPEHYLKVINTKIEKKKDFYQITHTTKPQGGDVPQVRFRYDFSPLSVVLQKSGRPWYDFLTSFIAILGGTYTIIQLCGGAADSIHLARRVPAKRL